MAVEDIIESIGDDPGHDYPNVLAWKTAWDGVNLKTGGVDGGGRRVIGEVYSAY